MRDLKGYVTQLVSCKDYLSQQQPIVEITSNNRVLIENHMGVTEYGLERICVLVSYGVVAVCGKGLQMQYISRHQLFIRGQIHSVVLNGKEEK